MLRPHIPGQPKKAEGKLKAKATITAKIEVKSAELQPYQYNVLVVRVDGLGWAKADRVVANARVREILEQVHFYDRCAVIETASIKGYKQGLGLVKRSKFSLCGQEMLALLAQLTHNLVEWAKDGWLN